MSDSWRMLDAELDLWAQAQRTARFWLRDDDAIAPTPALDRLLAICRRFGAPLLLAIIPQGAERELAQRLADVDLVLPCQHGFSHRNHAPQGQKPQELGLHRGRAAVIDDLRRGREKLLDLFGEQLDPVLVPPWNRIDADLIDALPALGFSALSAFGTPEPPRSKPLQINANVDIIDWRATRMGHEHPKLVGKLVEALAIARARDHAPVGILTHHLVHGEMAWRFLELLGTCLARHPAAKWVAFDHMC